MDLRSVLNTSDNGERPPPKAPPTPQQQQQQKQQLQQQNQQQLQQLQQLHHGRPSQSGPQYAYRDYPQQSQAHPSPGKPMSAEYPRHAQQPPSAAYPPASPYQSQYPPRPSPHMPPHAAGSFHDPRSPGTVSVPSQSPYRQPPTHANSISGYPFPPQEMASPSQRHQYPPSHYPHPQQQQQQQPQPPQGHESYPQGVAPGPSPGQYAQQTQQHHPQVPQTPPIGGPGGQSSHQYVHQRSQSAQSTPTPTSAQSQHQFGPPHTHGSPVPPSRSNSEYRQPSQPPTPLGPPQSAGPPRQPGPPANFAQPPSPYQHRVSSLGHLQQPQSPALNPGSRRVSGTSVLESPAQEGPKRRKSSQEREHSLSVSPRTRVTSVASISEKALTSPVDADKKLSAPQHQPMDVDKMIVTPAKRKLDDRNLSPKELEHKEARPPPGASNGLHVKTNLDSKAPIAAPKRKRTRHAQPPTWAQSAHSLGNKMPTQANFVLQKRAHAHLNGKVEGSANPDRTSRQGSPEASRASQPAAATTTKPTSAAAEPGPQNILGPWEASITGVKPYEEMSKAVADFIFIHVVNNPDIKEITSRGIQFEIEAKLGTLIDKDTNYRVDRLLDSECILHDTGRVAFRSSMTEAHHKAFNEFLNHVVIQTDPRAPNGGGRVQVHYKHRREVDKFFELTPDLQNRLPGCVRSRLGSRVRNVKVRVTYDQKTGQVLNKIVKARVADIDIYMPMGPMDCRLSINLEMDWDGPVEELEQLGPSPSDKMPDRQKDRLSYTQGHYQVDLTQVTLTAAGPGSTQKVEKEHELEIELASPIVLDQGNKAMSGAPHRYQELIEGLLDNVRVLARKAREFS